MKISTTLIPIILIATMVFLISFHYNKVNSDFQPKDTLGIGKQVCDVMNFDTVICRPHGCDTITFTITDTIPEITAGTGLSTNWYDTIPEINYGGESGFLNSKAYKEAQEKYDSDTITNSELDYSDTYTNYYHEIIINKGEVFIRADLVGEEVRAKAILDSLHAMLKRADDKINK